MTRQPDTLKQSRRRWLQVAATTWLASTLPGRAFSLPPTLRQALRAAFGDTVIHPGKVQLTLPALAENGNSVRLSVAVDSAMEGADHVRFIQIFAEANPLPHIARFEFGALSGRPTVSTRIRLAAEQDVVAIAGMQDGSLWSGSAHIVVTEAACLDALI